LNREKYSLQVYGDQLIKRIFLDDFERPKLTVASVRKDRIEMAKLGTRTQMSARRKHTRIGWLDTARSSLVSAKSERGSINHATLQAQSAGSSLGWHSPLDKDLLTDRVGKPPRQKLELLLSVIDAIRGK
jgi:hypothetical protein